MLNTFCSNKYQCMQQSEFQWWRAPRRRKEPQFGITYICELQDWCFFKCAGRYRVILKCIGQNNLRSTFLPGYTFETMWSNGDGIWWFKEDCSCRGGSAYYNWATCFPDYLSSNGYTSIIQLPTTPTLDSWSWGSNAHIASEVEVCEDGNCEWGRGFTSKPFVGFLFHWGWQCWEDLVSRRLGHLFSLKDAQKLIQAGGSASWGRLIELLENKRREGMGFSPSSWRSATKLCDTRRD